EGGLPPRGPPPRGRNRAPAAAFGAARRIRGPVGVRLLLDKMLAPALAAAGIASAPAIFRLGGDPEATSLVTTVDVPVDGTVGRFHLKRYRYPSWAKAKGLLGRGTGWGTAPEIQE